MAFSAFVWRHCRSRLVGWVATATSSCTRHPVSVDRPPLWCPAALISTDELAPFQIDARLVKRFQVLSNVSSFSETKLEKAILDLKQNATALSPRSIAQLMHMCKSNKASFPASISSSLIQAVKKKRKKEKIGDIETATIVHSSACLTRSLKMTSFERSTMADVSLLLTEDLIDSQSLQHVTDRILANVMYGLGVMFKAEDDVCERDPRLKKCIVALSKEITQEHHLIAFSQQGLANIVYAYGCLKFKSEFVLLRLSREIINRISGFQSSEIAYMILALSKLNYFQEDLIVTLGIEAVSNHHMQRFTQQDVCHIILGMQTMAAGLLSDAKVRPILQKLYREASSTQRLAKFNLHDASTLLHCVVVQKRNKDLLPAGEVLVQRLMERVLIYMGRKPQLTKNLSMILYNCAKLKLKNDIFLKRMTSSIVKNCQALVSPWNITLLLWSLAELDTLPSDVFLSLCRRLCDLRQEGAPLADRNWVQLTRAAQFMEESREAARLEPRIKDLLEEALCFAKSSNLEFTLPQNFREDYQQTV